MPRRRATWDTVGEIVSELPGTEEGIHLGGAPAWRVNGKVIVLFGPRLRTPDEDQQRRRNGALINIVTGFPEREALMASDPTSSSSRRTTRRRQRSCVGSTRWTSSNCGMC